MITSRRQFMVRSAAVAAGFAGLESLLRQTAGASLRRVLTETTAQRLGPLLADPAKLIDLPKGFSYHILSRAGESMDDGLLVPGRHDGMAAFPADDGSTILVRNHEIEHQWLKDSPFGANAALLSKIDRSKLFDAGFGKTPSLGGTTTIVYDTKSKSLRAHWMSLAGTNRNCAGGPTPWGSWLSCEEDITSAGPEQEKNHGYVFEVPVTNAPSLAKAEPIRAMGRFNHEAVCVDPRTGIVYLTEDQGDGLFYRFIPTDRSGTLGSLHKGGRLQALAVDGKRSCDTRNWPKTDAAPASPSFALRVAIACTWVDLDNIDPSTDDLRHRGHAEKGAAVFARGEGCWFGKLANQERGSAYFACTNGGQKFKGQIFRYTPSPDEGTDAETKNPGTLELFIQPDDGKILDNCDNICIAPWGDLIVCEDGDKEQFLLGVTPEGVPYPLARNAGNSSEWAGACFSPDGSTLFANIQKPGMTIAITGPWRG